MPRGWPLEFFLSQEKRLGETLLDIGCGNGLFVHPAKKKGYHVVGIDYNKTAIDEGRKLYGLRDDELLCTTLSTFTGRGQTFDVVTMFETLEHVDTPNEFMENIKKLLKPNGVLIMSVPNRNRFIDIMGKSDYPPMHLTQWSQEALIKFVKSHSFEIIVHKIKPVDGWEIVFFVETWLAGSIKDLAREKVSEGIRQNRMKNKSDPQPTLWKLLMLQLNIMSVLLSPLAVFFSLLGNEGSHQYVMLKRKAPLTPSRTNT